MRCIAKKTFEVAAQTQAQAIIQLKDNQPTLVQNAETACASQHPTSSDISTTKARNRRETRTVDVFSATRAVADTEWKALIKGINRITRDVLQRSAKTGLWSSTFEVAYYLAGFDVSASHSNIEIRSHWHIENKLHYTRDVTFQEDQSRIRCNPGVFARIRSFAYNMPLREGESASIQRPNSAPTFNFADDDDSGPELNILGAGKTVANPIDAASGVDLSDKKKIIFWIGRGKTGKTTGIRWAAEAAILNGTTLLMADMDPTNDTFSQYIDNVARPPNASDPPSP